MPISLLSTIAKVIDIEILYVCDGNAKMFISTLIYFSNCLQPDFT